ncbi:MAG: hypothetical protein A2557_13855 [Candidatus Lambdaproteobacteria bacterium RIFOXYD2_FULL_56_26]|uniref:Response regulatory domain-containing protein n=1 Tax=Candidatus Lambdaproteobacteria bacterium RIFOXYD2_FULL_56_26 TaxID=1817773 RepID=A0A1F6H006_9PROT|nr:MAG: hypothetical protein A2426_06085 [Candidatus Lambdaproteobacteria bacterium RIFOXYC1_FULL_56_13]OGH03614.1 MAG: hypothetical protein A2557_13855 [Candidatus Lambdaproteobacteria bacterium RIFOXYD2_FULL_56_26]
MDRKILVLENSMMVRELLSSPAFSLNPGWLFLLESDPAKFLGSAKAAKPDLILLSNQDEAKDYGTLKTLKQTPGLSKVPVLLLTSARDRLDEAKLVKLGAAGFVRKPFEFDTLSQQIKDLLAEAAGQGGRDELDGLQVVDDELIELLSGQQKRQNQFSHPGGLEKVDMAALEEEIDPTQHWNVARPVEPEEVPKNAGRASAPQEPDELAWTEEPAELDEQRPQTVAWAEDENEDVELDLEELNEAEGLGSSMDEVQTGFGTDFAQKSSPGEPPRSFGGSKGLAEAPEDEELQLFELDESALEEGEEESFDLGSEGFEDTPEPLEDEEGLELEENEILEFGDPALEAEPTDSSRTLKVLKLEVRRNNNFTTGIHNRPQPGRPGLTHLACLAHDEEEQRERLPEEINDLDRFDEGAYSPINVGSFGEDSDLEEDSELEPDLEGEGEYQLDAEDSYELEEPLELGEDEDLTAGDLDDFEDSEDPSNFSALSISMPEELESDEGFAEPDLAEEETAEYAELDDSFSGDELEEVAEEFDSFGTEPLEEDESLELDGATFGELEEEPGLEEDSVEDDGGPDFGAEEDGFEDQGPRQEVSEADLDQPGLVDFEDIESLGDFPESVEEGEESSLPFESDLEQDLSVEDGQEFSLTANEVEGPEDSETLEIEEPASIEVEFEVFPPLGENSEEEDYSYEEGIDEQPVELTEDQSSVDEELNFDDFLGEDASSAAASLQQMINLRQVTKAKYDLSGLTGEDLGQTEEDSEEESEVADESDESEPGLEPFGDDLGIGLEAGEPDLDGPLGANEVGYQTVSTKDQGEAGDEDYQEFDQFGEVTFEVSPEVFSMQDFRIEDVEAPVFGGSAIEEEAEQSVPFDSAEAQGDAGAVADEPDLEEPAFAETSEEEEVAGFDPDLMEEEPSLDEDFNGEPDLDGESAFEDLEEPAFAETSEEEEVAGFDPYLMEEEPSLDEDFNGEPDLDGESAFEGLEEPAFAETSEEEEVAGFDPDLMEEEPSLDEDFNGEPDLDGESAFEDLEEPAFAETSEEEEVAGFDPDLMEEEPSLDEDFNGGPDLDGESAFEDLEEPAFAETSEEEEVAGFDPDLMEEEPQEPAFEDSFSEDSEDRELSGGDALAEELEQEEAQEPVLEMDSALEGSPELEAVQFIHKNGDFEGELDETIVFGADGASKEMAAEEVTGEKEAGEEVFEEIEEAEAALPLDFEPTDNGYGEEEEPESAPLAARVDNERELVLEVSPTFQKQLSTMIEEMVQSTITQTLDELLPEMMQKIIKEELEG